jgi:hypothetical protein
MAPDPTLCIRLVRIQKSLSCSFTLAMVLDKLATQPPPPDLIFIQLDALSDRLRHVAPAVVLATVKVFLAWTASLTRVHADIVARIKGMQTFFSCAPSIFALPLPLRVADLRAFNFFFSSGIILNRAAVDCIRNRSS